MEKIKKVIIDTDLGADCDDVGALVLAFNLHKKKLCEILAITHCTLNEYGRSVVQILQNYHNVIVPFGQYKGDPLKTNEGVHYYDIEVSKSFKHDDIIPEDATRVLRKTLVEQEDNSVEIISIGLFSNLSLLIDSKPDDISPLSGKDLINKKVSRFVSMAGIVNDGCDLSIFNNNERFPEYNIECDIKSARNFVKKCEKEIYFLDFYCGVDVWTGDNIVKKYPLSPMGKSYQLYAKGASRSWDLLTIYWAITNKLYDALGPGVMDIDELGFSTFTFNKKGIHYYLRPNKTKEEIEKEINEQLDWGFNL